MNSNEQLQPPPEIFITPLLELRDYYAGLVEEYQRLFLQARSQLNHAEALLSNWSFSDEHKHLSQLEVENGAITASSSEIIRSCFCRLIKLECEFIGVYRATNSRLKQLR